MTPGQEERQRIAEEFAEALGDESKLAGCAHYIPALLASLAVCEADQSEAWRRVNVSAARQDLMSKELALLRTVAAIGDTHRGMGRLPHDLDDALEDYAAWQHTQGEGGL